MMDLKNAQGTAPILKSCKVVGLRICREAGQAMTSRPVVYITVCILWTNVDVTFTWLCLNPEQYEYVHVMWSRAPKENQNGATKNGA